MPDDLPTPGPTRRSILRVLGVAGGVAVAGASLTGTAAASNPSHCPRTPGFYKNHFPEAWPKYVTGEHEGDLGVVSVGSETYEDPRDLIDILELPPRGDKTIIMANQLIAAKLNTWAAPPGSLCSAIEGLFPDGEPSLPDAWLAEHPVGSGVRHWGTVEWCGETYDVEAVKDRLEAYNEGRLCSCSDDGDADGSTTQRETATRGRRGPPGR